jgi:VanZ family protein
MLPAQVGAYDKVLHFIFYALFAALLLNAVRDVTERWKAVLVAVAIAAAFAAVDEWHQQFVPGRMMDVRDWVADLGGATLGASTLALILRSRRPSPSSTR